MFGLPTARAVHEKAWAHRNTCSAMGFVEFRLLNVKGRARPTGEPKPKAVNRRSGIDLSFTLPNTKPVKRQPRIDLGLGFVD